VILYLHGFRSAPASIKAQQLLGRLCALGREGEFWCPQLPVEPRAAVALVEAKIAQCEAPPTLVGSSLGGYYATWLAEKHGVKAVLVNPAVVAPVSLADFVGRHTNLYTNEEFEFTAEHVAQLRALEVPRIADSARYLLILGTADELLDYRDAVRKYAGAQTVLIEGGDHGLAQFAEHVDEVLGFAGMAGW
jgi:hypothetical protein